MRFGCVVARSGRRAPLEALRRAKVAELADAPDLGSGGETRGGSSPPFRTMSSHPERSEGTLPTSRLFLNQIPRENRSGFRLRADARMAPQLRIWRVKPWGFESPLSHQ